MSIHLLFIATYALLIAAAALFLTRANMLAAPDAWLLSASFFVFVASLHLAATATIRSLRLDRAQRVLRTTISGLETALDQTDRELNSFKREVEERNNERHRHLVAEVKLLQTLLAQVVKQKGAAPAVGAQPHVRPVTRQLSDSDIFLIMQNALEENRIDLHLQPIVSLPNRKPCFYECLSRVRDEHDAIVYPTEFLDVAEQHGLIGTLDNLLLVRCVQMLRRLGARRRKVKFFCNISSASLADGQFLPSFVDFMLDHKPLAERLVFEFTYEAALGFGVAARAELRRLADAGFRFSVDQVDTLDIAVSALAELDVAFVKVDVDVLLSGSGDLHAADLKTLLERHDMKLIATKVETEAEILEVLELNIELGQGYLFGQPKPTRLQTALAA